MNDRLAPVVGVSAIVLFVVLLASAPTRPRSAAPPQPDLCRVGDGPLIPRERYVADLLALCGDEDFGTRWGALRALDEQRAFADRIVPVVESIVREEGNLFAPEILAELGDEGREALIRALGSEDEDERFAAAIAYSSICMHSPETLQPLFERMRVDPELAERLSHEIHLRGDAPVPELLRLLKEEFASTLRLARMMDVDAALPLAEEFANGNDDALRCLYQLGAIAEPALPLLQRELHRCNGEQRSNIYDLLAECNAPLTKATQKQLLDDIDDTALGYEIPLLGRCTAYKADARAYLRQSEQIAETMALYALDGASPEVVRRWREEIEGSADYPDKPILRALANVGGDIRPLLPLIAKLTPRNLHWQEAMTAGGADAVPLLIPLLPDEKAMNALGVIGRPSMAAVPALAKLARAGNRRAEIALLGIDPGGKETLAVLVRWLKEPGCRFDASRDICHIGPAARAAGPALREIYVADPDLYVGLALASIGGFDAESLAALERVMRTGDPGQRVGAAVTLFVVGGAAKAALPVLRRAQQDCSPEVACWATAAIDAISGDFTATNALLADPAAGSRLARMLRWLAMFPRAKLPPDLLPGLIRLARKGSLKDRFAAIAAAAGMGRSAIPFLREVIDDPATFPSVRRFARRTLAEIEVG